MVMARRIANKLVLKIFYAGHTTIMITVFVIIAVLMICCFVSCVACCICLPRYRLHQQMRKAQQPQQPGEGDSDDKC